MKIKNTYKLSEDVLRYGNYTIVNSFDTGRGYYTIRIIEFGGKVYFHKMLNGKLVEFKVIGKSCSRGE